jgi:hypothetical protein
MQPSTRFGLAGLALAAAASLATLPPRTAAAQDAELETGIREIALAVGNTYVCAEGDAAQAAHRDMTRQLFDHILQDTGSNRAFLFAVSVGYGASVPKAELDCEKLQAQWQDMQATFELVEPGQ